MTHRRYRAATAPSPSRKRPKHAQNAAGSSSRKIRVHISVHGLVSSLLSPSTPAKRDNARRTGRLGGRPKKPPQAA